MPSPLGEGQAVTPINRLDQGEVHTHPLILVFASVGGSFLIVSSFVLCDQTTGFVNGSSMITECRIII